MVTAANPYRDQRTQYDPGMGMDELCDALNLGLYIGVTSPSGSAPTISSAIISFLQSGSGATSRTSQAKHRDFVDVRDFGAVAAGDVGAAVNLALAAGHKRIRAYGSYALSTQILVSALNDIILDLSEAEITASSGLDVSLIRFLNASRCVLFPGVLDGFASGQTSSSFGVDLNGGSHNHIVGGRITNCKTYGAYIIGCNYAHIERLRADNNQQSGIAGDVGSADVTGVKIKDVVLISNGVGGSGALSGLHLEGNDSTGFYFKETEVDGVVGTDNRGSAITFQNVRGYSLANVNAYANYRQGITLTACLYGSGGHFSLDNNDAAAASGYDNGLAIDDSGVTPASQYNNFFGVTSRNHSGFAVIERGTANNNTILGVDSVSDGGVFSMVGANSIGMNRRAITGALSVGGSILSTSATGGIGYATGAGGTVTQATSKSTGVTLNAAVGRITMNNAALAGGALVEFVLTNSAISSTDHVLFNVVSGATQAAYIINVRPANGSATVEVRNNTGGSLSEAIVIGFTVIKGAVA